MIRYRGPLGGLSAHQESRLLNRGNAERDEAVSESVANIVYRVRAHGDSAIREVVASFDRVALEEFEVPPEVSRTAWEGLDRELRAAMQRARDNISTVHRAFMPEAVEVESEPGVVVGRRPDPLARVGVYAPGGRAAYPSSVLMGAIPARIAGVGEVVLCSPPGANGLPSPLALAASHLAEVDRVFAVGGPAAIAAMAYGTETIPRVDCIVGPGNAFVTEAKAQISRDVPIDVLAGQSELLVIADEIASPERVARELLAQAEHDPEAVVVALAVGDPQAQRITEAVEQLLPTQPRRDVIENALDAYGAVLSVESLAEAVSFANEFAAEHALLAVDEPSKLLGEIRTSGTVFCGLSSSVAFGDYMTGANHVLPTGGSARATSGLSTLDFMRWTTYQYVDPDAAARLSNDTARFASEEGLAAHAAAAESWKGAEQ